MTSSFGKIVQFSELCGKMIAFHDSWECQTKRKIFSLAKNNEDKNEVTCIVMFKGDVDDLFGIQELLEEKDKLSKGAING